MIYYNYKNQSKGFTLIELMVVFSVLTIMALSIVLMYRRLAPETTLMNSINITRTAIQRTRSAILLSEKCCGMVAPPSGYGFRMDLNSSPTQIILFADDGSNDFSSNDRMVDTISLPDAIQLTACGYNGQMTTTGSCTLVFSRWLGMKTYLNGVNVTPQVINFTLTEIQHSLSDDIQVYGSTFVIE